MRNPTVLGKHRSPTIEKCSTREGNLEGYSKPGTRQIGPLAIKSHQFRKVSSLSNILKFDFKRISFLQVKWSRCRFHPSAIPEEFDRYTVDRLARIHRTAMASV